MKEITAIVRPNKMSATKNALDKIGFPAMTAIPVLGKGKQRGISGELNFHIQPRVLAKRYSTGMKYIPKRLLSVIVNDEDVDLVVKTIIKTNQTAQIGDGRIFVESIDDVIRIRTGEKGETALK
jgi:nitrogen regulatory protein PII 2